MALRVILLPSLDALLRIVTHCYAFRETDNGRPTLDRNETNYSKNVAGKKTTPEQIFGKVIVAGFCLGTE